MYCHAVKAKKAERQLYSPEIWPIQSSIQKAKKAEMDAQWYTSEGKQGRKGSKPWFKMKKPKSRMNEYERRNKWPDVSMKAGINQNKCKVWK